MPIWWLKTNQFPCLWLLGKLNIFLNIFNLYSFSYVLPVHILYPFLLGCSSFPDWYNLSLKVFNIIISRFLFVSCIFSIFSVVNSLFARSVDQLWVLDFSLVLKFCFGPQILEVSLSSFQCFFKPHTHNLNDHTVL